MPPKRNSASAFDAPAMNQAVIRQLVVDSVAAVLEAQAANMANADHTNRNPKPREALVASKCSYKEFMSCQPLNFKGSEGDVGLICWFERTKSVFSRSNYIKDCKVKFATSTLTKEALSWWNSFAQPIGIEEAYKLSWVEFKKLLIKSTVFELSFDVIVGMDWLSKYHAKIICDEKVVHIPIDGETLIIRGLHVDPTKIEAIKNWASPTTPIEIRQFLRLAGYYWRFIKDFLKIAKSLTELTQKNKKYIWGKDQDTAFQLLKQKLCEAPILALPK
nr:putative reverse transcriptase domain-containing protein [Tanacetum cinerariifolium]